MGGPLLGLRYKLTLFEQRVRTRCDKTARRASHGERASPPGRARVYEMTDGPYLQVSRLTTYLQGAQRGRRLRWHSGACLSRNSLPFKAYISKVREREIISGKAKQADKTVRQFHK